MMSIRNETLCRLHIWPICYPSLRGLNGCAASDTWSHRFETEPSEQALWADYNNGAGWKNLALQGVENRWIEFGKFIEQQKVYIHTRSLKLCESNLETYHVKTHQSVWGCSLCTVTSPSVSNPSYHNPRVRRSRLVESHKAYCGNRQVEGVRVLRNNVLSFKLSLLSKENKSSTYTYWVEVSVRSVKGCTLVSLKRRNLFSTVLYSDEIYRTI